MNYHLTYRQIIVLQIIASSLILGGALISQYGFGLYPCELCIYQRIPYAAIIALGLAGLFLQKCPKAQYAIILLNLLLFIVDAGIAGYHTGVEMDIFEGPSACSSTGSASSIEELRAQILDAPLVSCKQAMGYVLGLSLAAWNMMAAIFLAIVTCFLVYFRVKKPHANGNI